MVVPMQLEEDKKFFYKKVDNFVVLKIFVNVCKIHIVDAEEVCVILTNNTNIVWI